MCLKAFLDTYLLIDIIIMIWSKYNYLFEEDGHFFLYNSVSNSFAELDEDVYSHLKELHAGEKIDLIEKIELPQLEEMKAIVEDDRDAFLRLKYQASSRRFSNHQLLLTINPTLDCNFSCPYCFETSHAHKYMSEQVEDDIIKYIRMHKYAERISVTWFGGEPLLAFKRIVSLTEKMLELNLEYSAGIITNGYLLTDGVISKLNYLKIKSIQITLDGLAEAHDKRRYLRNGQPTFAKIVDNIKKLILNNDEIHVNLRVNIDNTNKDSFLDIYRFFNPQDYPGITITPAFVDALSATNKCVMNSAEQYQYIMELFKKHNISFTNFYPLKKFECGVRNPFSVVIGPEGELYKCWNDVGNISKIYGYIDGRITNESLLLKYLVSSDPFDDVNCKECLLLPICDGGCPYQRIKREYEDSQLNVCPLVKDNLDSFLYNHYKTKNNV